MGGASVAWLVPTAVLLLIVVVAVRSLRDLGQKLGWPLLVGGLLAVLLAIFYPSLIASLGAVYPFSAIPALIQPEAFRAISRLAAVAFRPMLIQAVVLCGVGLLLIVLGAIKRPAAR